MASSSKDLDKPNTPSPVACVKNGEGFLMKSPTGEIIKINTPEKIHIKKASVVLEKLGEGDIPKCIPSGVEKSPSNNTPSAKSFPFTIEYKIKHNYSVNKSTRNSVISPSKPGSIDDQKTTAKGTCSNIGNDAIKPSTDLQQNPQFINAFSNEKISQKQKIASGLNMSSVTIKHEDSLCTRNYISREKYKSSSSLENHSNYEEKINKSFITDMVTSPRLSLGAKMKNDLVSTDTSPPKQKTKLMPTHLSLIKLSDVKRDLEIQDYKPALQRLEVVGKTNTPGKLEGESVSPLKEARNHFTTKLNKISNESAEIPPLDKDVMQVKKCKVAPTILSHNKSKTRPPTVRELLQKKEEMEIKEKLDEEIISKDFSNEDTKQKRIKNTITPQKSIPGKRTSVPLMVDLKGVDDHHAKDEQQEASLQKSQKSLTRRYKNTRYTIPYRGPSIIVPKNYDALIRATKSKLENSAVKISEMSEDKSKSMRQRYKKTGKITTTPLVSKTSESLIEVSPGIHTMKETKGLLNVRSMPAMQRPICNSFECKATSSRTPSVSPTKNFSTSYDKLPGLEKQSSDEASLQFYSIQSTERVRDLVTEQNYLDTVMTMSEYESFKNYQMSPLKTMHQKGCFTKKKAEKTSSSGISRPCCNKLPQTKNEPMPNNNAQNSSTGLDKPLTYSVPSNSPFRQSPAPPEKDCSGCFYCEYERLMRSIDSDSLSENSQDKSDHDYTKPHANTAENCKNPIAEFKRSVENLNLPMQLHSDESYNTPKELLGKMPFYTFQLGDKILLMPYSVANSKPQHPTKRNPKQETKEQKKTTNDEMDGAVSKKKRTRKTTAPKRNNFKNICKDQLKFSKILDLIPAKERAPQPKSLELVVDFLNGAGKGEDIRVYAPVLHIERSTDDVYTHISTVACFRIKNGSDAGLKRWNDFDDYPVRLTMDTVSGAITEIEVDTNLQGLYKVIKTGQQSDTNGTFKSIAILSAVLPNVSTILNASMFLAIGPSSSYHENNCTEQPANIQKYKNIQYLLTSIENLLNQPVEDPVVSYSDQSYRPKCHSPSWYQGHKFDAFTRLYHRQRKFKTTGAKTSDYDFFIPS
ncbi:uncharacterized protein LOC134240156 [Saccostrea cucullata]|uniref:uncharacterized protein LOC134240156 n=1 Tax=Saccostrea cuccullata TaxID=36930 RepID=UPI002ED25F31